MPSAYMDIRTMRYSAALSIRLGHSIFPPAHWLARTPRECSALSQLRWNEACERTAARTTRLATRQRTCPRAIATEAISTPIKKEQEHTSDDARHCEGMWKPLMRMSR